MRRLAHISDLHFGAVDDRVVEALAEDLDRDPPDLVIASGDFTQGARRSEFAAARAFLARLRSPWIAVPGNHDVSPYHLVQRFFDPYRRFRRFIQRDIEPVWRDDEVVVVGLNSARRMALELNWSYGRLNRRQIARAVALLSTMPPDLFRVVVVHHPPLPPPWALDTRTVGRAEEALAAFERAGVGLVLAGHLHRGYASVRKPVLAGESLAAVIEKDPNNSVARTLNVVQAGSATSTRLRDEPNSYNRITVEAGRAQVEARIWTGTAWVPAKGNGGDRAF